jgi:hypothetical protein
MAQSKVKRWLEIAREVGDALPGEWTVRGPQYASLVREPVEWVLPWISYGRSVHGGAGGWLSAGVLPLVEPFTGWHLLYGLRMDSVPGAPRTITLDDPTASEVARDFALGPALEKLNRWSPERMAEVAEIDLADPPEKRDRYWWGAPAWRVIFGSGSPTECAAEAADKMCELEIESGPEFYDGLVTAWDSGGRDAALDFLRRHRDTLLAQQGMETPR